MINGLPVWAALPVAALVSVAEEAWPPFHADWTAQEQEALRAFDARFQEFLKQLRKEAGVSFDTSLDSYKQQVESALKQAVQTGQADVYMRHGDSLARVAAYMGCPGALKAFVKHGCDPLHTYRGQDGFLRPMTAVMEVVAGGVRDAENRPSYTLEQRQELLQWLAENGVDFQAVADDIWLGGVLSLICGEKETFSWVCGLGLPAPKQDMGLVSVALKHASLEALESLLKTGIISLDEKDSSGMNAVQILAASAWEPDAVVKLRLLLDAGFPLASSEDSGKGVRNSPLELALRDLRTFDIDKGDAEDQEIASSILAVVEELLKRGCRLEHYPSPFCDGTRQRVEELLRRYGVEPCQIVDLPDEEEAP